MKSTRHQPERKQNVTVMIQMKKRVENQRKNLDPQEEVIQTRLRYNIKTKSQ